MAADTFAPPFAPSPPGTGGPITMQVRRAEFGDGYSQRARDGLNYVRRTVTLSWSALSAADLQTIVSFFKSLGGADSFTYMLPLESTQYTWTCATMTPTYVDGLIVALTAVIVEEFDLP